jgi:hypothetical protein
MKTIRDSVQIIGMLERGETAQALTEEIEHALKDLADLAGPKTKAKGSVTLKLSFCVEGTSVEIEPEIITKLPKSKRSRTLYFLTPDGELSTEHPQQTQMQFGQRERESA